MFSYAFPLVQAVLSGLIKPLSKPIRLHLQMKQWCQ